MMQKIKKILRLLPRYPHRMYTIFCGTNSSHEIGIACRSLFWSKARLQNEGSIRRFEQAFAATTGSLAAFSFGAGRMALYALFEAWDLKPGDEVILPAYTCVVVPNALIYRKLKPVYVDIDPVTFNIDPSLIEAKITPRTRVLYAQHTFGLPCEIDQLRNIAKKYNLKIVEDAAHALGATYKGRPVGSLGDAAIFSSDHSKVINTVLGGVVTVNDSTTAGKLALLQASAPFLPSIRVRQLMLGFILEYFLTSPSCLWFGNFLFVFFDRLKLFFSFHDELQIAKPSKHYPSRLSAAQAELGLEQLNNLKINLQHRRKIAAILENRFHSQKKISFEKFSESAWLRYSFLVNNQSQFEAALQNRFFDLGIWFKTVVHGRSKNLHEVGYELGSCPQAEWVSKHIANLPTHSRIPEEWVQNELDLSSVEFAKHNEP